MLNKQEIAMGICIFLENASYVHVSHVALDSFDRKCCPEIVSLFTVHLE